MNFHYLMKDKKPIDDEISILDEKITRLFYCLERDLRIIRKNKVKTINTV